MIRIQAKIKLYKNIVGGRRTAFYSGYRPLFNFIPEMRTSGQIILSDRHAFYPGEEGVVEIIFLNKDYLGGNFGVKTRFTFTEGMGILGEGEVVKIIATKN